MASERVMCEVCRAEMLKLLQERMRRIIKVYGEEGDETAGVALFHLMEIGEIIQGKPTTGVYDDHGKPSTIRGPLFDRKTA